MLIKNVRETASHNFVEESVGVEDVGNSMALKRPDEPKRTGEQVG